MNCLRVFRCLVLFGITLLASNTVAQANVLTTETFTDKDAILVTDSQGKVVYQWRADQMMVPASLTKLATMFLAIDKWGLAHQFQTNFYQYQNQLWVKGVGDPYLISEELDRIVTQINQFKADEIKSIHLDINYFANESVPGRSKVNDPYNAPLTALAANFNTVMLQRKGANIVSAEAQTPITPTALRLAKGINSKPTRVNLKNNDNAQRHFAEILSAKLGLQKPLVEIDQSVPSKATLLYRHKNSNTLETVLRGAMKYSNNFIANLLFLNLASDDCAQVLSFAKAQKNAKQRLQQKFVWNSDVLNTMAIHDGAGLSRDNRLTAQQIDDLLLAIKPYQVLMNQKKLDVDPNATSYVKTGTLNGVSNYAGFINLPKQQYRFVFMFNRQVPYGYRDKLLQSLARQLAQ